MKRCFFFPFAGLALLLGLAGCTSSFPPQPATQQPVAPAKPVQLLPFDPVAPIVNFDLQGYIDKNLAAGFKTITVPPGRYRVTPRSRVHLSLQNLDGVTIVATGVEMICTETTQALSIKNCRNLTLRGLAIDYDPLPFSQARITALAPDKSWIEFQVLGGYPENLVERIEIFDGTTGLLKTPTLYGWQPFEALGSGRYRVAKSAAYKFNPATDLEVVGDILVTNSQTAPHGSAAHAIASHLCVNLVLEDINLFASNCFSYLETYCDNTTYRRCSIDRCPPALDVHPREVRRLRSSDADAYHSKFATRGPQLLNCTAKFMGDDCVNICGEYYLVLSATGRTVRLVAPQGVNIQPGHEIELFTYTGLRLPDACVEAVTVAGTVKPDETAYIKTLNMNAGTRTHLSTPGAKAWVLTLDREVVLPRGSVVASTRHTGNGFLVKNCDFGYNRSRGILIKGSRGQVVGNHISGSWMAGVLVAPEWWWLESGSSSQVVIRDNVIADCRQTAIRVVALGGNGAIAPAGAHRDITIRNNRITNSPLPCIEVTSTTGLVLGGNQYPVAPVAASGAPASIKLANCTEVMGE